VEKSGEAVACPAARNPSHGLARRDCPRCADDRRRAYVMDNHGGLTPPLLAVHAFVHRKSRHFTCRDSCIQAGAAGVSPPWCAETHLQGRYRKSAGDCRRCAGERHRNDGRVTTGGDAPSSCVARMRVCWGFAVSAARALPNHGGLTPPALGSTCVCASRKSPCRRHTFAPANRSGGRQPAVVYGNAFARAIPQTCGGPWPVCRRTS
jgi:hypothetical protein